MLHLPKHTYHRWHQYVSDRHWWQKRDWHPPHGIGRTIHTNMKNVFCPHVCHGEGVGPLLNGGSWLPDMDICYNRLKDLLERETITESEILDTTKSNIDKLLNLTDCWANKDTCMIMVVLAAALCVHVLNRLWLLKYKQLHWYRHQSNNYNNNHHYHYLHHNQHNNHSGQ